MSEKISLETVLPIAAQVFNALPKVTTPALSPTDKDIAGQYAELFAQFALTIHKQLNCDS